MTSTLQNASADSLSKLLTPDALPSWPRHDTAAILAHQLAAPLRPDLTDYPGAEPARVGALLDSLPHLITFANLLAALHPPRELLTALRHFARHHRSDPASPLRGHASLLLYFAAIAAGLVHRRERLTSLPNEELHHGLTWSAAHPAANPLADLYRAALITLPLQPRP